MFGKSLPIVVFLLFLLVIPVSAGTFKVLLFEDFNTTQTKVIAKAPAKGYINLSSGVWGYVVSGEYSGPCSVGGPPQIILCKSVKLSNGQVSHGGAIFIAGGEEYYCDGWRKGGSTYIYHDIHLPDSSSIMLEVRFGKPGWSYYENKPTDGYAIIKIIDLDTGKEKILFNKLIGGDYGCGWFVHKFNITEFKGHTIRLILEGKAGGNVRMCPYCTGTWDGELVAFDWVKIITYNVTQPTLNVPPINVTSPVIVLKADKHEVSPGETFDLDIDISPVIVSLVQTSTAVVRCMLVNFTYGVASPVIPPQPPIIVRPLGNCTCCNCSYNLTLNATSPYYTIGITGLKVLNWKTYGVFDIEMISAGSDNYIKYIGISKEGVNLSGILTKVATVTFKVNESIRPGSVIEFHPIFASINNERVPVFADKIIVVMKQPWQRYDRNGNGRVDDLELLNAIQDWLHNKLKDLDLLNIIMKWLKP